MKVHNEYQQGSLEWLNARAGIPTASELDNIITPKWTPRKPDSEMVQSYVALKAAEWWIGGAILDLNTFATEQGHLLEDEALPWLELEHDVTVERVGFITTDDGSVGCSPDGLIGKVGLEVKCLQPARHTKVILAGVMPEDYIVQVQASMWVTGFEQWRFLSYSRRFPKLLLTVDRDEKAQAAIGEAIEAFRVKFRAAKETLINLNGGMPKRFQAAQPAFQQNENDIPTP